MKKSKIVCIIIAICLIVSGLAISTVSLAKLKFNFESLATQKIISNEHNITQDFSNIKIDVNTSDIEFVRSKNNDCIIVAMDQEKLKHIVLVENNTLLISLEDNREWYDHIGISFGGGSLTIHLPKDSYDLLNIASDTSDIIIPDDFTFDNVEIETNTGDVEMLSNALESLNVSTDTGDIKLQEISSDSITLETHTGKTNLTNVNCNSLASNGSTGDIILSGTIATGSLNITRSTGDVNFDGCDANEIFITTDTGDISGSLLTPKIFVCNSDTGDIKVPKTTSGGKCEITTDTGDIYFREVG